MWEASLLHGIPVYFVQDIETSYYARNPSMQDAVLAWGLLKPGGIAIFDDYDLVDDVATGLQARVPARALDAFVSLLGDSATVLRRDWQLVLRKQ